MSQEEYVIKFRKPEEIGLDEDLEDILFTDNLDPKSIIEFSLNRKVNHIVQMSNVNHPHELAVSLKIKQNPSEFFEFPLSTLILCPEENNVLKEIDLRRVFFEVQRPDQKQEMLDQMQDYLKNNSNSISLIGDVLNVADELFTNAIYNAPYIDAASRASARSRPFDELDVDQDKRPYLFISNDFERIVLGCCDQYGSLDIDTLLGCVQKCYGKGITEMINYSVGGAGIGCYLILEKSSSVYIGVQKGVKTMVCCAFPLKKHTEKRSQMPKNLHLCRM